METTNILPIDESSESVISGNCTYQIVINGPDGSYIGTITGDNQLSEISELKTELIELKEIEKNQLTAIQQSYELQENTYTLTAYIFAALLGFGLIQLFKGVLNSIFGG